RDLRPAFAPPRPGDVKGGAASVRKIRAELGYKPSVRLSEGLSTLVEHIKDGPRLTVSAS
ncbi:MAG: LPS biosynthesis protein WbpP, partial [Nitrososphaerales archaeon]